MPRQKSTDAQPRPGGKEPVSFRLTPAAKRLIAELAQKMGIAQSAVLEVAIRNLAKEQQVD